MTDKLELVSEVEAADWFNEYPEGHREMLMQFGVPTWMNERADAHNRRLVAAVESGCTGMAELAALAEQSFNEHFGGMLAERAMEIPAGTGRASVRHVDMGATDQVSIANSIGCVMDRYRNGQVAAMAGFTVDRGGAIRPVIGGQAARAVLHAGLQYLRAYAVPAMLGEPQGWDANVVKVTIADRNVVHTRNPREQQEAVARAVRTVTERHDRGDVQFVLGATVDEDGMVEIFGGGETAMHLIERSLEALRRFVDELEQRYDH